MEFNREQIIKELTEKNERLRAENEKWQILALKQEDTAQMIAQERQSYFDELQTIKADTVRKMQELIAEHATNGYPRKVRLDVVDQIAKEMLEDKI